MLYVDANARWWRVVNPARLVVEGDDGTRGMADLGGGGPWIFPVGHQRLLDPEQAPPMTSKAVTI